MNYDTLDEVSRMHWCPDSFSMPSHPSTTADEPVLIDLMRWMKNAYPTKAERSVSNA